MEDVLIETIVVMYSNIFQYIIVFTIIITVLNKIKQIIIRKLNYKYFKKNIVNVINKKKPLYVNVSKRDLEKFNITDIEQLKNYFYDLFIKFENAYNNLDYNVMKMISTKELFHNYHTGISLDLKVNKKKVITNIERKRVVVFDLFSTSLKQVVSVMIEISYNSYTLKDGYIISGSRDKKIKEKFEVIFRKDFEKKDIVECPNCGAEVLGNRCLYCRSILKDEEFKISSIKKIVEE